jgi:hypothetical protein
MFSIFSLFDLIKKNFGPMPQASRLMYNNFDLKTNRLNLSVFFSEFLFENLPHLVARQ